MMDDLFSRQPPYDAASKVSKGPSVAAGNAIRERTPSLREHVLIVLKRHPAGLTADEIAERMGKSILAVRPRVTELGAAGSIEDTGLRRRNDSGQSATVWRIKP